MSGPGGRERETQPAHRTEPGQNGDRRGAEAAAEVPDALAMGTGEGNSDLPGALARGEVAPGRAAPGAPAPASPLWPDAHEGDLLRVHITRRRLLLSLLFVTAALAFLYLVLPQLGGVRHTWDRLNDGDAWWIAVAFVMEVLSLASYIVIFRGVYVEPGSLIGWRGSYEITMAGLAATRLFAAGGAGGVAVTVWALTRSGMAGREVARRTVAFLVLLYGVYMLAMVICGVGLYLGLFTGQAPFAITIGPAILGAVAIIFFVSIALVPVDLERRLGRFQTSESRFARALRRLAAVPASLSDGIHFAWQKLRHPELAMIGTVSWWGFNIAVLYAAFEAFGEAPPVAVVIQAYFVGMLANLLPLPGGIGGVDGGMIGAFVAFGVGGSLALIAVLVYRLLAFWLPTIPGIVAYFQLRRTVRGWRSYTLQSKATATQPTG
jgi:uncharacterized protein (TIRG00374 family)